MNDKIIKAVNRRLALLEESGFELETWKTGTVASLIKWLGETDPRLKLLDKLRIDYSSWALRDATANYNPRESTKKNAKEILLAILDEYSDDGKQKGKGVAILPLVKKHLTVTSYKELTSAISNKEDLLPILKKCKKEELAAGLAEVIKKMG